MTYRCARTSQREKMRSNASVGGNRVYILDCQNAGWNFGLILPICRNMVLVSDIHVLAAAFFMGLASAAPMGPVNMLAIRRGMIGGWRRTLACAIGSVAGDLILFSWSSSAVTISSPTCPTRLFGLCWRLSA